MTGHAAVRTRHCGFGPITVAFDDRVLAPRAWTLMHSEWARDLSPHAPAGPILELCAGAGQIGLAAAVLAGRDLIQVEADEVAAGYATENAVRAGFADRVNVRHAAIDTALRADERFPIVLADPPYLPTLQVCRWPADPVRAIDGGPDGLDLARRCLTVAAEHMESSAVVLLQVAGDVQAEQVVAWLEDVPHLGLAAVETRRYDPERAVTLLTKT